MTTLFACSSATWQGNILWALNGVGLGVMVPNAQSLVADYYDATHRGRAFGMLLAVGNMGAMLSSVYATNIAGMHILGMQGWRFAFLSVAVVSALTGLALWLMARDPRCDRRSWRLHPHFQQQSRSLRYTGSSGSTPTPSSSTGRSDKRRGVGGMLRGLHGSVDNDEAAGSSSSSSIGQHGVVAAVRAALRTPLAAEVWVVLSTPSFIVVVVQGFLGSTPWGALAFTTLFLQLQGWSDAAASGVMALFAGADAVGAFVGGAVGDWAAARFPDHGRIAACQLSVGVGVPMFLLIFQGLPLGAGGWVVAAYGSLLALTGVLISWAATACNNPIFAEIVPPHLRTLVYALDRCLEVSSR
eukprot:GHRQ01016644.1.p1 GENE.GHRQ01016644.1~~GHRQ01016644.1.p1  ORF type:complete len:356 (+),score=119.42 GHRQ01016644.1:332-1399(+)